MKISRFFPFILILPFAFCLAFLAQGMEQGDPNTPPDDMRPPLLIKKPRRELVRANALTPRNLNDTFHAQHLLSQLVKRIERGNFDIDKAKELMRSIRWNDSYALEDETFLKLIWENKNCAPLLLEYLENFPLLPLPQDNQEDNKIEWEKCLESWVNLYLALFKAMRSNALRTVDWERLALSYKEKNQKEYSYLLFLHGEYLVKLEEKDFREMFLLFFPYLVKTRPESLDFIEKTYLFNKAYKYITGEKGRGVQDIHQYFREVPELAYNLQERLLQESCLLVNACMKRKYPGPANKDMRKYLLQIFTKTFDDQGAI